MPRESILFILIGPSASGKNTLMKRVQEQIADLPQLPTYTTRKKRPGEREGREHYFVSRAKFKDRIIFDAMIEYQKVHMGDFYGTPRRDAERP
jgi:guanylate kinase